MAFAPSASWNSRSITHLANYPSPSLPMISSDQNTKKARKQGKNLQQRNHLLDAPNMIAKSSFHRWCNSQGLMHAALASEFKLSHYPRANEVRQGDNVDFDEHILGEAGDLDGGARGRIGSKMVRVDLVHGGEVVHAFQKDGGLDHLRQRAAGGGQNARDVLQNALGLRGDVSGNELLGGGIEGDLAGEKDEAVGLDGLGVRADGFGAGGGGDDLTHASSWR